MRRFTPRGLLFSLALLSLSLPYSIITEIFPDGARLWVIAPIWAAGFDPAIGMLFEIPLARTVDLLPFWGLGFAVAALVYYTTRNYDISLRGYMFLLILLMVLQLSYMMFFRAVDVGGIPTSVIPLPLVPLGALLLTPLIFRKSGRMW
ncbi:MAG: hypothetical protein ACFFAY_08275 [Promethearchaeota archaeon]